MTASQSPFDFQTPYGAFKLRRYPSRTDERLFAWCSADALLVEEVFRRDLAKSRLLVVNDTQGALCVALRPQALWTDSALAALALRQNERANGIAETPVVWSHETPGYAAELVVLRIPKQLPFFEYQLTRLARHLPAGATVLAAGMDKHLSPHTARILERIIGPTQRHPGQRKARLFSATRNDHPAADDDAIAAYFCAALDAELQGLPNVFSRDRLDLGSRFLLEQLHRMEPVETLIDLACGNGVLGLCAVKQGLASKAVFCDESAMAVASARRNAGRVFPPSAGQFSFYHGDGLRDYTGDAVPLILCNPPFHLDHAVDEFAGRHLLGQCNPRLAAGGSLYLVANRHINYVPFLRGMFSRVEYIAGNARFNILLAGKD